MSNIIAASEQRKYFFDALFSDTEGYLCIALVDPKVSKKVGFSQQFFRWPDEALRVEKFIFAKQSTNNVYFCINLLSKPDRKKAFCMPTNLVWADLDEVQPMKIETLPPSIVIQSSEDRYQAIWRLSETVEAKIAESYSKRLAYHIGADVSGWDLTQLLRVPFTWNFKYDQPQRVTMTMASKSLALPKFFDVLPKTEDEYEPEPLTKPVPTELPSLDSVIYKYRSRLSDSFSSLMTIEPDDEADWSKILWRLINICFDAGMGIDEVFVCADNSACNKYERDKRPKDDLWRDILKAEATRKERKITPIDSMPIRMPKLVDESEITPTFLDQYREWAIEATDAPPQFHDLCAMIMLSSVVCSSVRLRTSYNDLTPNLWGMILGESTVDRKTTSMRMVTDILMTMDRELVMATDGSPEGLLTGLQTRPHKASMFFRDELSGFFSAINNREYLSGMPEILAGLYDVPKQFTRRLRKETIAIESPAFVFLGGGVTSQIHHEINDRYIMSGFLPRFLVVQGEADRSKRRHTGPPTEVGDEKLKAIVDFVADLYETYSAEAMTNIGGQKVSMPPRIMAQMKDQECWELNAKYEDLLVDTGIETDVPYLSGPTFDRMSKSLLKMAVIFAAVRQRPDEKHHITIETQDLKNAAWYVQQWGKYSIQLIVNAGKRPVDELSDKVLKFIVRNPGVNRHDICNRLKVRARELAEITDLLEEAQVIRKESIGRGYRFFPL